MLSFKEYIEVRDKAIKEGLWDGIKSLGKGFGNLGRGVANSAIGAGRSIFNGLGGFADGGEGFKSGISQLGRGIGQTFGGLRHLASSPSAFASRKPNDIAMKLAADAGNGNVEKGMKYALSAEYTGEKLSQALGIDINQIDNLVKNGQIIRTLHGYKLP